MRQIIKAAALAAGLAAGLGAGLATGAKAQDAAIETVIQSQIEAFLAGDVEAAFAVASPTIQRIFGSAQRFGSMVERGYPMVWRPSEVRYLEQRALGDAVIQTVMMRDEAGVPWVLRYQMIEGPGGWVINGVEVLRPPELGA